MESQPSLIAELEAAIQGGSSERRSAMLRRVTDLFVSSAPHVTDAQAGVFDDVFEHLIKEIEWKAVVELSDRVAAVDNAPERLIMRLAYDDAIEISGPVLESSPRLADTDLLAIARTKSQAHLAAIAGRPSIDESVTEALVDRGNMTVARKVAGNNGARFSDLSLNRLVDRARDDGDLADAIARRRELPAPMFRNLVARATDAVRKRLLDSAEPGAAKTINTILAEVSQGVEDATAPKRDYRAAMRLVGEMHKQGGVAPMALYQFAKTQKIEEMIATLSLLSGISAEIIDRFVDEGDNDPMLILCKAIDLDWNTTLAVLAACAGQAQLHEARADEINRKYRKLSASSAQRVLRFWQAREKLAQAG
jgi:uncharacterized protein (DUF2336 family)